ncbi:DUF3450 domain-containing protein [Elizabethkingia anophelis]|uniref:DUF3450 domain-containing protein n=1 Tax=Elizabethkingia anophelis TaxID=1117645 RepID=UPI00200D5AD6|nr:DUF3450 domain-containing protein [Elizabethkingia anophelis]MCL1034169.1 DUF3450 domain-containing protein [Elizabethkingia anophelis]MCW2462580.1 hypothetical protein [Elizabethkingia anophelis]MCW2466265.1 hypothetical protein [Elizabethkingia anophelis]MCW2469949.1 hypothetical protein [Elizabethkingia anophelis]
MKNTFLLLTLFTSIGLSAQSLNPVPSIINPGTADTFTGGYTFAYKTSGTPWNGALISFGGFSNNYDTQLSADYGPHKGNHLSFRTRNGDAGVWNNWQELATKGSNEFSGDQNILGNLGIGTTAPEEKLDIKNGFLKSGSVSVGQSENKSPKNYISLGGDNHGTLLLGSNLYLDSDIYANSTLKTAKNHPTMAGVGIVIPGNNQKNQGSIIFHTTSPTSTTAETLFNNPRMIIKENGNVGIGTTDPQASLDINGLIAGGGMSSNLDPALYSYKLNMLKDTGKLIIGWNISGGNGETDFIANRGGGNSGGFHFYDYTNEGQRKKLLVLNSNGNALLEGKLEAKEIKVTSTPTADFVFEDSYQLPDLASVEKHIKEKKHLPEIASAAEMQKEGVNIGDFQIKLLQKIEELTLYSIEQNKQNKELFRLVEKQQEQIKNLEKNIQQSTNTK